MRYAAGKQDGPSTSWHANGRKRSEAAYKGDRREGPHRSWYADGNKAIEGSYKAGEKEGLWTVWNEGGQKMAEGTGSERFPAGEPKPVVRSRLLRGSTQPRRLEATAR